MYTITPALAEDAPSMAALFRSVYSSSQGLPLAYPFPQYTNPDWLASSVGSGGFAWLVARCEGEIAGCLGAARDIGALGSDDRVAELTGLVVGERWRLLGIGRSLLRAMVEALEPGAAYLLAEVRTGNAGGWKGTLTAGFLPIGFEPLAHHVLGRHEPMLMMGKATLGALAQRRCDYQTSAAVHELARVCLAPLGARVPGGQLATLYEPPPGGVLRVHTAAPEALLPPWLVSRQHASGVVGLRRIRGTDPGASRFIEEHLIASVRDHVVGVAEVSVDLHDRRCRILSLEVESDGWQGHFVREIIAHVSGNYRIAGLAIVVLDVRADFPALHASLEACGFFPSIYYPALIATPSGRVDAVQFTRLHRQDLIDMFQPSPDFGLQPLDIIRMVCAAQTAASRAPSLGTYDELK